MEKCNVKINSRVFLDLINYKTKKCNIKMEHSKYECFYYHDIKEKRRNPFKFIYCHILCKKSCNDNNCKYSNNKYESFYHKMNYKKKLCLNYMESKICQFGKFCSFAHHLNEWNTNFIHKNIFDRNFFNFLYKSEFCFWGKIKHDKSLCVYSHNFQDYRRTYKLDILRKICKYWNLKENYLDYNELCKTGINCNYCHGYKEFDFLPDNYKSKRCKNFSENSKCKFGGICHFIHPDYEKKTLKNYFLYVSKNKYSNQCLLKIN